MTKYKIKLNGLKDGSYKKSFVIGDKFFEAFPTTEIKCVDIEAKTTLDIEKKKMALLVLIYLQFLLYHLLLLMVFDLYKYFDLIF